MTVPSGMMLSLMTTTMPSLITNPRSSLFASLIFCSLVMRTLLPILAFLSTIALRTTVLAPAARQWLRNSCYLDPPLRLCSCAELVTEDAVPAKVNARIVLLFESGQKHRFKKTMHAFIAFCVTLTDHFVQQKTQKFNVGPYTMALSARQCVSGMSKAVTLCTDTPPQRELGQIKRRQSRCYNHPSLCT